jgi:4-hydroxybenzoate polyprenyltransferase
MAYLRLVRLPNLLMLALMLWVFKYGFLDGNHAPQALNGWQYALLVFATVFIAAAGYVINDIFDQETDSVNRPKRRIVGVSVAENKAYRLYIALNVAGVALGFVVANIVGKPVFSALFIMISITLYMYASGLKQNLLTGNVIVAALLALSVLTVGIFDLYPIITPDNRAELGLMFKILLDYAAFAFLINLLREIVKDAEDIEGDDEAGMHTLAVVLGRSRTARLLFWSSFLPVALLGWYINHYFIAFGLFLVAGYALALVLAPLLYFTVKISRARSKKDFRHLSGVLKAVIFLGILSVAVLTYNIQHRG